MNKSIDNSMPEKRLTEKEIAEIIKMRGLGYSQEEIAQRLCVSQSAIQYQLARINKQAKKEGDDDNLKEFEKQIVNWSQRMDAEPQKVAVEVAIAQFMLIYNIDMNISLIRDLMAKKP